jgi:hypothetical protein
MSRLFLALVMVAVCVYSSHHDGYDRTDLAAGYCLALLVTWVLGYQLPKD